MARYAYHGRSPSDGGWASSVGGAIRGQAFTIFDVDVPPPDEERDYRARSLYDLPGEVEDTRTVSITGGLSENLGAAIKFHQSLSDVGVVFVIDRDRYPQPLTAIEYNYEWASDHPGTYARIDSIDEFEVYDDGELVGAGYFRSDDGVPIVNKWREQVQCRIDNFAFADESELAVYGAEEIDFRQALFGTASYLHTSRAVGGSVQGALANHPGFRMGFGTSTEDVTRMEPAELARRFQRLVVSQFGGGDSVIQASHMVVLYDEDELRVRDETEMIPAEAFILATDGSTVFRDPSEIDSAYLGQ